MGFRHMSIPGKVGSRTEPFWTKDGLMVDIHTEYDWKIVQHGSYIRWRSYICFAGSAVEQRGWVSSQLRLPERTVGSAVQGCSGLSAGLGSQVVGKEFLCFPSKSSANCCADAAGGCSLLGSGCSTSSEGSVPNELLASVRCPQHCEGCQQQEGTRCRQHGAQS